AVAGRARRHRERGQRAVALVRVRIGDIQIIHIVGPARTLTSTAELQDSNVLDGVVAGRSGAVCRLVDLRAVDAETDVVRRAVDEQLEVEIGVQRPRGPRGGVDEIVPVDHVDTASGGPRETDARGRRAGARNLWMQLDLPSGVVDSAVS